MTHTRAMRWLGVAGFYGGAWLGLYALALAAGPSWLTLGQAQGVAAGLCVLHAVVAGSRAGWRVVERREMEAFERDLRRLEALATKRGRRQGLRTRALLARGRW